MVIQLVFYDDFSALPSSPQGS